MCIFCKIAKGEVSSNIVLEDEDFLCFHDLNPAKKIHVLVIPKNHYESFNDVPCEVMGKMTYFIKKVVNKLEIKEDGYRLITNIGKNGGQEVKHLHFHILGGEEVGSLVNKETK